jgi:trimeric autotransporter adhesin
MRKLFTVLVLMTIGILLTANVFAQSPEKMSYQAVIRNSSDALVINTTIGMQISILQGSENGTVVYSETQSPSTNTNGLVSIEIGIGAGFSTIDWANDTYFIKTETDPAGGTNYTITGTSQLLSVPYALHAKTAESVIGTNSSDWKLSGNTGTISGTDFIGTTDNQDFDIRTNNAMKWRFKTNGTLAFLNTGHSIFIGEEAGANDDLSNNENIFIGYQAGNSNTIGSYNIANGYLALYSNTTGNFNTVNGSYALYNNTLGSYNTANGYQALYNNTTGRNNSANASRALYNNTTGSSNVAIGSSSLYNNTVRSNLVAIGDSALFNNGTGATTSDEATGNTAIGSKALYSNTTGHENTANGYNALYSNTTGFYNTANGYEALYSNTTGHYNSANGFQALYSNTTGYDNTANGYYALYSNTIGHYNTALGYYAFYSGSAYENSTALGYEATITASNQIRLGNSSVASIGGYPAWTSLSDKRFKKDVMENVPGLNFIMKLKPVTYHLDMDAIARFLNTPDSLRLKDAEAIKANMLQTGFLAQDVEKSAQEIGFDFSGVDAPKNENDHYGLRYAEFVVPLVKATQEQQVSITELKQKNIEQKTEIEILKTQLQQLTKKINDLETKNNE